MASPPPPGVYVPVPTFFIDLASSEIPEIDVETQCAYAVYLASSGIRGQVLLGSTGEGVYIHRRERQTVIRAVRDRLESEGFKDYPLLVGTATQNIEETLEQLSDAQEAGAQWSQCLVPAYNAAVTTEEGIFKWFTILANRSPLPLVVYNYPGVSNMFYITSSTLVRLSQHPNIVGCKLSHGDISLVTQITLHPDLNSETFRVYTGMAQVLLPVLTIGGSGCVDGGAGCFPKTIVRLYELSIKKNLTEKEEQERRKIQFREAQMAEFIVQHGVPGIKEAISRLRQFGSINGTRLPLFGGIKGGDQEWSMWRKVVDAMEEIEDAL